MNDKRPTSPRPAGGMALDDIYFVLFRHKWKIIILSLAGFAVAGGIWFFKGAQYQSEAQLLIKYVVSSKPQGLNTSDEPTHDVDEGVINTEVAILSSFDLAMQVATNIGASNILAKAGGGHENVAAADYIRDNLTVDRVPRSPVLRVVFSHPDPAMVQPVLKELIDDYQRLHTAIHGAVGQSYDSLMSEALAAQVALHQTEEELHDAKVKADISDLDDSKKSNAALIAEKHDQILNALTDYGAHKAMLARLKGTSNDSSAAVDLAVVSATNAVSTTNAEAEIPQDKIDQYTDAVDYLAGLKKDYFSLRDQGYSLHSKPVQEKQDQIDEATKAKKKLEAEEPRLAKMKVAAPKHGETSSASATPDLIASEEAQISALQARIASLQQQMKDIHSDATNLDAAEPALRELERKRRNQEDNWSRLMTSATQAKIEAALGASKNANIEPTQAPTPPRREHSKLPKMMALAAASGVVLGLAWAFLVELYFDTSVKRPKEIEKDLGLRLFLSIPDIKRNGHRLPGVSPLEDGAPLKKESPQPGVPAVNGSSHANGKLEVAPWDQHHSLHNHYEALRDRLIAYFEANNLTHKPKLVAVTGSARRCGTTTIAAGLAASMSETGDGNVLLIDMNMEQGAAQYFYKGKPGCELDDALASETRNSALVQENLYVVNGRTNGDKLSRMLPRRFANLVPKLKASDFDYIIFDMPPIARTGVTQRLAGFMDMMLLVVESEKTSREVVKQAGSLLNETKANVSVVLNKTRTYVPHRLHQEF